MGKEIWYLPVEAHMHITSCSAYNLIHISTPRIHKSHTGLIHITAGHAHFVHIRIHTSDTAPTLTHHRNIYRATQEELTAEAAGTKLLSWRPTR